MNIFKFQVNQKKKRCLIILPNATQVIKEVCYGITEGLGIGFDINERDSKRNFLLSTEVVIGKQEGNGFYEEIERRVLLEKFDVIFTLGKGCSMMLQKITTQ